jgi:hypothetical protein
VGGRKKKIGQFVSNPLLSVFQNSPGGYFKDRLFEFLLFCEAIDGGNLCAKKGVVVSAYVVRGYVEEKRFFRIVLKGGAARIRREFYVSLCVVMVYEYYSVWNSLANNVALRW